MSGVRRAVWPLVVSIIIIGVLFLAVFPSRTYVAQRHGLHAAEQRVALLAHENSTLAARVEMLNTDAEIERLARQQYSLVKPGEEAYAILPSAAAPPPPPTAATDARPPAHASAPGFLLRLWHALT